MSNDKWLKLTMKVKHLLRLSMTQGEKYISPEDKVRIQTMFSGLMYF